MRSDNIYLQSLDQVVVLLHKDGFNKLWYQESPLTANGETSRRRVCIADGREVAQCKVGDTHAEKWVVYPGPSDQVSTITKDNSLDGAIPIDKAFRKWVKTARDEDTWQGAYQSVLAKKIVTGALHVQNAKLTVKPFKRL